MTFFVLLVLLIGAYLLIDSFVRRAIRQRPLARHYRAIFIARADDLVGKPEFPSEHAHFLVYISRCSGGVLTGYMTRELVRRMFTGGSRTNSKINLSVERVPSALRQRYVEALLAFILSDSYFSVFYGPIYRAANPWIKYALKEVKPDVDAHATRAVVDELAAFKPSGWRNPELVACAV